MLENLEHPQVLADLYWMGSDNLGGVPRSEEPGNQQERLIDPSWVTGFVDGEGCFSIGLVRQPERANRKGYKTGYQVSHEFAVTQGAQKRPVSPRPESVLRSRERVGQQPQRQSPGTPLSVRRPFARAAAGSDHSILPG